MSPRSAGEQDLRITEAVERNRSRLWDFIRRRVPDPRDAEDVLQDVFSELVEATRLLMPIEHVTGWLFRVARNRIIDLIRRQRTTRIQEPSLDGEENPISWEELLPSPAAGPEAVHARAVLLEALELAVDELPPEQRDVFLAHEVMGQSFKAMSAATGVSVNTLLSRKRYAVLHLRERLQRVHDELMKG